VLGVYAEVQLDRNVPCSMLENTRKYRVDCHGEDVVLRRLLITGSGGSGTHSTSEMFAKLDLELPHENAGRDGATSWLYAVDAEVNCYNSELPCEAVYPFRFRHWNAYRYRKVFHQTRCPLRNIGALLTHKERSFEFVSALLKVDIMDKDPLLRAVLIYLGWNNHIEQYADYTYQIERMNITDVCLRGGFPPSQCAAGRDLKAAATQSNQRSHEQVTMDMVRNLSPTLADQVQAMGIRYGYEHCMDTCDCQDAEG